MHSTILIVGASSGIGKHTALSFFQNNWKVIACSRNFKALKALSIKTAKKNLKIEPVKLDITNQLACKKNIEKIIDKYGIPDIVFLNAGTNNPNSKNIASYKETKKLFEVNFFGIVNCIDLLIPHLEKKRSTQLVIMSSVAGYRGLPYAAAYCSSKAGLISFAEAIYNQCYEKGINVRVICPGFVKTPLTDKNKFKMPMIISSETAGNIIYDKLLNTKSFEIVFPKLFCYFMKILKILPNFLYLKLTSKLLKKL
ncbi:MAG: putative oxidoreductase [Alphaproteobacteria bacterium MarineAlpha9_Bin4]|nr:short-chain dehydrogenase [Pelagibacterales bacterium]PPR27158.1 MAG: putative oxidoreductase [Alphaproteobacteria bacterium MarineAlpha9_Bin4]|tara:strand:- start:316 stop:1077 length:762 start_codon:yes stop_codon:yes gene_type:complete